MKRIKIILLFALLLGLVACSGTGGSQGTDGTDGSETTDQGTNGDKTISFAINANFPPYMYYEGEELVGIDIELAKAIGENLGYEIEFQDMKFDNIIASVNSGKADAGIGGITKTEEREKSVKFSDPYQTAKQLIVVPEDSDIAGPDDLEGRMIATQVATTGDMMAQEEFGMENVQSFDNGADAILALNNGKVEAVIIDSEPAKNFADANDNLKVLDTEYVVEEYGIIFNKNNEDLYNEVNGALNELIEDGTVEEIINKYINE